ncbi:hypothetical protein ACHWQZ_G003853 [Mnemiopsis leidyi]
MKIFLSKMRRILLSLLLLTLMLSASSLDPTSCEVLSVVESIPDNLTFSNSSISNPSTTSALMQILGAAQLNLDIAEYYFDLRPDPPAEDGSDEDGKGIWEGLLVTGHRLKAAGGALRIVHNLPDKGFPDKDSKDLAEDGAAQVQYLDFKKLIGGGIIHTKLWIADQSHFYLGSANMDWQSLRQVKELGILGLNCPAVAQDLQKLFEIYWYLTTNPVPDNFPAVFDTIYNSSNPIKFQTLHPKSEMTAFLVSSPPQFCTKSRTVGIDGLLQVLNSAEKYIHIEVMDYFPAIIFKYPNKYWPIIDDALRRAVFDRGVELRLLVGLMPHNLTRPDEFNYLSSLAALDGSGSHRQVVSKVKMFIIPSYTPAQSRLTYARVNHAKFVVTEKHTYVSTSNWSGDYFTSTGGISLIMENGGEGGCGVCGVVHQVFDRDWSSEHTQPLRPWGSGSAQETQYPVF